MSESSYFLSYIIDKNYGLLHMNMLRRKLKLSKCLSTMQFNLMIRFIVFGSSVITTTELKCSSSPAIAAHQPHKA